jgi:hypothetical protein
MPACLRFRDSPYNRVAATSIRPQGSLLPPPPIDQLSKRPASAAHASPYAADPDLADDVINPAPARR